MKLPNILLLLTAFWGSSTKLSKPVIQDFETVISGQPTGVAYTVSHIRDYSDVIEARLRGVISVVVENGKKKKSVLCNLCRDVSPERGFGDLSNIVYLASRIESEINDGDKEEIRIIIKGEREVYYKDGKRIAFGKKMYKSIEFDIEGERISFRIKRSYDRIIIH